MDGKRLASYPQYCSVSSSARRVLVPWRVLLYRAATNERLTNASQSFAAEA